MAGRSGGGRTWGAYQHYGSPNFRFFDHAAWPPDTAPGTTRADTSVHAAENAGTGTDLTPASGETPGETEAATARAGAGSEGTGPALQVTGPDANETRAEAGTAAGPDIARGGERKVRG